LDDFYDKHNIKEELRIDFGTMAILNGALDLMTKEEKEMLGYNNKKHKSIKKYGKEMLDDLKTIRKEIIKR